MEEKEIRKEKIKNWLKDNYNLAFLGLIIFTIILRFYYFVLTKNQPLWWDEADYLAYAKNLAGLGVSWIVTTKHNSLFPFLAAAMFKIGFGETAIKFLFQFIPAVLSVVLVYLISNEMYKDKRMGLISAFLMAVLWDHIFNTTRFHVDIPALFTGLFAIYIFWKGYENKEKIFGKINPQWALPLTVIFVMLTYMIRRGYFLFGVFIFAHLVFTKNWKSLIKDKSSWISLILVIGLFLISENLIFNSQIEGVAQGYFHKENPIDFSPLKVFAAYFSFGTILSSITLYLFWIGFIILLWRLILTFGHIKKDKISRANLFNILIIIITLAFFIYILRTPDTFGEPRWYYPLIFSSFICFSHSILLISDYLKKHNKAFAVIFLVLVVILAGYYQVKTGDAVVKNKIDSFTGMREAGLLLKEISNEDDLILTLGMPQVEYYSEKKTVHAREWVKDDPESIAHFASSLISLKDNPNIKYILVSFSEPGYPDWMKRIVQSNGGVIAWEIPFMETKIDFAGQKQDIKESRKYGGITFNLVAIKQDVFVYEIIYS